MQQRFKALTGIRAIAAIMVFLFHNRKYWRGWLPDFIIQNLNEFHTGVSLFFVLSGFLIAYTYQDKPLQSTKEYCKYLFIRFARIFPIYIIILTAGYIDFGFPKSTLIFYNYTLLKGFSDKYNLDSLPQAWSLTVELSFYIIAPFMYFLTRKNIIKTVLFLLALTIIAFIIGYTWYFINGNPERWLYNWLFIFGSTFFGRFPEFLIGLLLAHYLKQEKSFLKKLPVKNLTLITCILMGLSIYCISIFEKDVYDLGTEHIPGLIIRNLLLPVFIALFLYALIIETTWLSKILSTQMAVLLGNASYIFYLVHIGYVNRKTLNYHFISDRNFVLLWAISITAYLLIEKPIYNFVRNNINKW